MLNSVFVSRWQFSTRPAKSGLFRFHHFFKIFAVSLLSLVSACAEQREDGRSESSLSYEIANTSEINTALVENSETTANLSEQLVSPVADVYSKAGRIEHVPQRPGNPAAGRRALLEESYVSCGLPERVFRQLLGSESVVEVGGRTHEASGLPFSTNIIDNEYGVKTVVNNCLTCHGSELFGELVIGLGNEFLDFTSDSSALVERAGLLVRGGAETSSWEKYADRIAAIAPYIKMHTIGVNPANNLTLALIAHRNAETQAWSETPLLALPPKQVPPVSVPPWWRMAKKPAMFSMAEGQGDHARLMMAASMMCSDDIATLEKIDAYAPDIRAFIVSLTPPPWPFEIDQSLLQEGQAIFEDTCSRCHGSYGEGGSYPGLLVPIETVMTDSLLVDYAFSDGRPYIDWFNRSYYGEISKASPGRGYIAPPLDGIWATAPYLHNGSVPNLSVLLNSQARPVLWQHREHNTNDPKNYDQNHVGWKHEELALSELTEPKPVTVYDTRLIGYRNTGHSFGDHLSDNQRAAVIEYLKSL